MIYHVGEETQQIKKFKNDLNLEGDVYIYNNIFIESLESHKRLIPDSTAETIEQAYDERVEYERILEEKRAEEVRLAELEAESEEE